MPLLFPNRYTYSTIEKRAGSNSSVKNTLYVISRIYLWGELRELSVEQMLFYGDFLRTDDVADLVDFIQFTSKTQKQLIYQKNLRHINAKFSNKIIRYRPYLRRTIAKFLSNSKEYKKSNNDIEAKKQLGLSKDLVFNPINPSHVTSNLEKIVVLDSYKTALGLLNKKEPLIITGRRGSGKTQLLNYLISNKVENSIPEPLYIDGMPYWLRGTSDGERVKPNIIDMISNKINVEKENVLTLNRKTLTPNEFNVLSKKYGNSIFFDEFDPKLYNEASTLSALTKLKQRGVEYVISIEGSLKFTKPQMLDDSNIIELSGITSSEAKRLLFLSKQTFTDISSVELPHHIKKLKDDELVNILQGLTFREAKIILNYVWEGPNGLDKAKKVLFREYDQEVYSIMNTPAVSFMNVFTEIYKNQETEGITIQDLSRKTGVSSITLNQLIQTKVLIYQNSKISFSNQLAQEWWKSNF